MTSKEYINTCDYPSEIFHAVKVEGQVAKIVLVNPCAELDGVWDFGSDHQADGADGGEIFSQGVDQFSAS